MKNSKVLDDEILDDLSFTADPNMDEGTKISLKNDILNAINRHYEIEEMYQYKYSLEKKDQLKKIEEHADALIDCLKTILADPLKAELGVFVSTGANCLLSRLEDQVNDEYFEVCDNPE